MRIATLTHRFSILSLALVLLATLAIGFLVRQHEIDQLENQVEDHNVVMTKVFMNLLANDVQALLGKADDKEIRLLTERIADMVRDSDIAKLKLYNRQGKVVFSTDPKQLGEDKSNNSGFTSALNGKVFSELTHRDKFSATEGERFNIDLVSSYVPVQQEEQVIAVFELYQDVTPLLAHLKKTLWQAMLIVLGVLAAIYAIQTLIVHYAQRAIRIQEKKLEAANRTLDRRVTERTGELEQSKLRISELLAEQRLIFNNAHVGILLLQDRKILKGNQRIADMFGYASPEAFEGKTTEIFYRNHEEFMAAGQSGYTLLATQGYADFEVRMRHQDGHDFWVIQSGRPLNPGAVLRAPSIWVYTDITERKEAETEIGIAATAFESQEGMMVTDASGTILRVNKAFTDTTGYSAEEVIGKTPAILRSDRQDADFYAAMWKEIDRTGFWQGEIWDKHKSGRVYPKWLTISAVLDREGGVTHYVGTHTDITERKLAEEKIRHLAFYDQLTELPNRTLLQDRLKQAMVVSERSNSHGALLFLDLDHFKTLNDTLGHDHGDMLLRQVARLLAENVRQGDTVARLGGDEFVILLLDLDADIYTAAKDAESTCRKLLAVLKQNYRLNSSNFHSSASIGCALFRGEQTSIEELLKQADLAMYKSKEAGRNTFHFFDPAMEARVLARSQTDADLRQAIQEKQFLLHYQPQTEGKSSQIIGAEVLVRWLHPQRGLIPPNDFIPSAEESGLIVPIGQWVMETACQQLALWANDQATEQLTIAVNVSVQQFKQPDFVEQVIALLEQTGANPQRLKLELTESLFAQNIDDIIGKMSALKSIGVGFSLDDFGTGYSSLAYLSRLPLDQLKIDRSFVMDIETSDNNVAICAATISLAHSLGLKVVAEGVETEAQRYFLTTVHHCDFLQGYLLGKPLPLAEFEARAKA